MPETTHAWWQITISGFEVWRIIALSLAIFLGYFLGKAFSGGAANLGRKTGEDRAVMRALANALSRSLGLLGLVVGLRIGLLFLQLDPTIAAPLDTVLDVLVVMAIGWVLFCLVEVPFTVYKLWSAKQNSKLTEMLAPMLRTTLRLTVIILTLVQIAQIFSNEPITSIIAGLGIGGLAFALAAQDSLKHLFGSIVIFMDRPFEVGDRVIYDGFDGVIEEVGFRSTRVRLLTGNLATIPNGKLADASIENVARRPHIRRVLNVTITYDTPPEKVIEAKKILEEILSAPESTKWWKPDMPPRVCFNDFNAASLNIIVIYWFYPPTYWDYMAYTEWFNLELLRRYNEAGIEFAFPTQTLYLAGDPNRPLNVGLPDQAPKAP